MLRARVWAVLALALVGCGEKARAADRPAEPPFKGKKLVVGVIGANELIPALRSQQGEWSASSGAEVEFREAKAAEVDGLDVLVFPGEELGGFIDRSAIVSLPESKFLPPAPTEKPGESASSEAPDAFNFRDIAPAYRDQVAKYGKEIQALPLGGSCLVLAYRRDAFENATNQAEAKAAGITLEPPKTWEELDALAKFFHNRDWERTGKPKAGIALAWGADTEGIANTIVLSRAAALGQHRDQYSFLFSDRMEPRIATPPFVEALDTIVALAKFGPPEAKKFDAAAAREAFRTGAVPLLIDRAEMLTKWSEGKPVGTSPLPGSLRIYNPDRKNWETVSRPFVPAYLPHGGGWLVGVASKSANRDAAIDFIQYYAGPDITNRLRSEAAFPMLATRNAQLGQGFTNPRAASGVDARPWADAVSRSINAVRVVVGLRIPEADGYLADLTTGRLAAFNGQPAAEALKKVEDAWTARTKTLGTERQTWHYRRSLNSFVTGSQPPARGK